MEQFTEDTTLEYFLANKEKFILPVDKVPTDDEIIGLLNSASVTMAFHPNDFGLADVDGLEFDIEALKFMQNNPHHMEGPLVNHIALMLYRLRFFDNELAVLKNRCNTEYGILERAIFWSDIGKLATAKPSPKKAWDDGTPHTTCYGHDEKSVEILDEATHPVVYVQRWWYKPVRWLVAEHMNAHKLEEQIAKGKTEIPDFLVPQIEGLEPWNYPAYEDLDIPHGVSFSKKKHYNWIKRNHKLLIIKQKCDADGRISDLSL